MFKWAALIFTAAIFFTVYQQHNPRRGLRIQSLAYRQGDKWRGQDALGNEVYFDRVGNDLYINGKWYGRVVEEK